MLRYGDAVFNNSSDLKPQGILFNPDAKNKLTTTDEVGDITASCRSGGLFYGTPEDAGD